MFQVFATFLFRGAAVFITSSALPTNPKYQFGHSIVNRKSFLIRVVNEDLQFRGNDPCGSRYNVETGRTVKWKTQESTKFRKIGVEIIDAEKQCVRPLGDGESLPDSIKSDIAIRRLVAQDIGHKNRPRRFTAAAATDKGHHH
jgi:hypothetical protein